MPFTIPNVSSATYAAQAGLDSGDLTVLGAGAALTGVVSGCAVTAQTTPDATVAVGAGIARVAGRRVAVAGGNVTLTAADATNPRHDLITADTAGALAAVAGSPAAITTTSEPVFPAIPAGRVVVAAVYRPAATTVINTGQITDKRVTITDPGVENVTWYGATGDGATDDTTAIQAAITASVNGSTILFPLGTYIISAPIRLVGGRAYIGAGYGFGGQGATIKQKNGANISEAAGIAGLLVADAWYTNASLCDVPILVQNLYVDGNKANNPSSNACGIIIMSYWTIVDRCQVYGAPLHGIHLTDVGRNGTTVISNSASENRVLNCRIDSPGGHGISQVSANGNSNMDGFCEDNLLTDVGLNSINFGRGAGWVFRRNHIYGCPNTAISIGACFATVVDGNYIEDFGAAGATGVYYGGIVITQLDGRGSVVTGNFVGGVEPNSLVGDYEYITATAGSGQTDAHVIIANNHLRGITVPTVKGYGLVMQSTGGGVLHVRKSNNRIVSINRPAFIGGVGQAVIYEEDSQGREHAVVGASTSAFSGAARGTSPPALVFTGNDLFGAFSFGTGTATTTGSVGGVTFEAAFAGTPSVSLTPGNAATAALGLWAAPTTTGVTVNVTAAPAASQAAGTYVVYYRVSG